MRVQVKKWGNSASVRIPAAVLAAASLRIDQVVDVREVDGAIMIVPIKSGFDLETLLSGITPENLPGDVDFGAPVGKEIW